MKEANKICTCVYHVYTLSEAYCVMECLGGYYELWLNYPYKMYYVYTAFDIFVILVYCTNIVL